mgnify:CR=1 FL=1|jgi:hypothetical protein
MKKVMLHFAPVETRRMVADTLDRTMCGGTWNVDESAARLLSQDAQFEQCPQCIHNWRSNGRHLWEDYRRVVSDFRVPPKVG